MSGVETVIIRAYDAKGNSDFQTYTIHINDSLAAVALLPETVTRLQCFPNPITNGAHFLFTLEEHASVDFEIVNMAGLHIATLTTMGELSKGPHVLEWNRTNDLGTIVGAGVYLCRMHIRLVTGESAILTQKLIVL